MAEIAVTMPRITIAVPTGWMARARAIPTISNPTAIAFETPFRRILNGFPVCLIRLMASFPLVG